MDYTRLKNRMINVASKYGVSVSFQREDNSITSGTVNAVFIKATNVPVSDASGAMYNSNQVTIVFPATKTWEPLPGDIVTYTDITGTQTMRVKEAMTTALDPTQPLMYEVVLT